MRCIAEQDDAPLRPGLGADLQDLLRVEERRILHAVDEPLRLPAGIPEPVGPELLLVLDRSPVDRGGLFRRVAEHEVRLRLGGVVAATHDLPPSWRRVGLADVAIGSDPGHEPVRHVQAGPPVHVRPRGEEGAPDPGSLPVRSDEQVESLVRAVGEVGGDLVMASGRTPRRSARSGTRRPPSWRRRGCGRGLRA